MSNFISNF